MRKVDIENIEQVIQSLGDSSMGKLPGAWTGGPEFKSLSPT